MSPSDVSRPGKPETDFDRDAEWDALVAFACDTRPGGASAPCRDGYVRATHTS